MSSRPAPEPWERAIGESALAFQAFTHWLEGHDLLAISKLVAKHRNTLGRWRARYRWDARKDALEAERDAKLVAKIRTRRRQIVERHLELLDATEALIAQGIQKLDRNVYATLPEVTKALATVVNAKRTILGMPTATTISRQGPPMDAREELSDAAAVLRDPELLEEFDRLAARVAASHRNAVANVAGVDGRGADAGPVEPSPTP